MYNSLARQQFASRPWNVLFHTSFHKQSIQINNVYNDNQWQIILMFVFQDQDFWPVEVLYGIHVFGTAFLFVGVYSAC